MAFEALDKPYSIGDGPWNPEKVQQLDEMLEDLYRRTAKVETTIQEAFPAGEPVDVTRWKKGPWTFDGLFPTAHVARLVHELAAATEYADFAPEGIDSAVELSLTPLGAGSSVSGIRHYGRISRKICISNASGTETLTIPHEDATSTDRFRFNLPNSEDIELGPYQVLWASYNPELQRWQCMITPHDAGGLSVGSAGGPILTSVKDLSEAELESLDGSGAIEHIAAPAATDIHVPLLWIVQGNVTTAYGSNPNLRIRYGLISGTPDIFTPASVGFTSTGRKAMFADSVAFVHNTLADYKGAPIGIDLSAVLATAGTGVATVRSIIYYVTLTAAYS